LTPQRLHAKLLEELTNMSKAYLLGAMHDATERKTTYRISSKEKSYVQFLAALIHKMGHNAWIYQEGKTRSMYVVEFSKMVISDAEIKDRKDKIDYIRGYFDAEGSVPRSIDARFYIYFAQKNKEDLEQLKSYLTELGITCGKTHNPSKKNDPEYWRFFISCKAYAPFKKKINSWHPVKRQLLRMKI
jgi:intein-encoded DNA endonuclease-like protein